MQTLLYHLRAGKIVKTSGVALTYSRLYGNYPLHGHDYYEFEAVRIGRGRAYYKRRIAANTANTLLVGRLPGVIAFPITNVGVIVRFGVFLKEKITKRQIFATVAGIAAVIMFNS